MESENLQGGKFFNLNTGNVEDCPGEYSEIEDMNKGNVNCKPCPPGSYCKNGEHKNCEDLGHDFYCENGIKKMS